MFTVSYVIEIPFKPSLLRVVHSERVRKVFSCFYCVSWDDRVMWGITLLCFLGWSILLALFSKFHIHVSHHTHLLPLTTTICSPKLWHGFFFFLRFHVYLRLCGVCPSLWVTSLKIMPSSSFQILTWQDFILFLPGWYSIVCLCHNFFSLIFKLNLVYIHICACTHTYSHSDSFPCRLLQNIVWFSLCYFCFTYSFVYKLIPNAQYIPSPPSPLWTQSPLSVSESVTILQRISFVSLFIFHI